MILCCAAMQIMEHGAGTDRNVYGPYFCLLEPKYLAVIAINCATPLFRLRLETWRCICFCTVRLVQLASSHCSGTSHMHRWQSWSDDITCSGVVTAVHVCAADTLNMILSASSAHKSDPKQRYFAGKVSMVSLSSQLGKVSLTLGLTATLLMARHVKRG